MASQYMIPLFSLPAVITEPGIYLTRGHELVDIKRVSSRHDFGCEGSYIEHNIVDTFHKSGRLYATVESNNDILMRVPS